MMLMTILDRIVVEKRQELELMKRSLPVSDLKKYIVQQKTPLNFASALKGTNLKLIAEVKKASPSRGVLCPDFHPVALAKTYARGGAAAISVLTEAKHFQGSLEHLEAIRKEVSIPLLRKDFIFDPYQVYESAAFGADALLLITAILSQEQLKELLSLSRHLGLDCLVEVHNENEVDMSLHAGAEIIGINNRDLSTFDVDINITCRLRPHIPEELIVVSESGIKNGDDVKKIRECGVNAILVGEALVTAADITARMKELLT
ncbi:MAG: indole-3-glycerol phosphate synthase [Chloroflexi bacterium RBG_16_50_9]|nr:MAG: indole-3-glycerol phosphate synthase [Chloroflexi bacterium RBG_16_50_9]